MHNALIGYSGFVGTTLLKQTNFKYKFRSTNINQIDAQSFDLAVCAAAPAQKWIANQKPEMDRQKIDGLIAHLKTIQCNNFVLISTVDVYKKPLGVDENTPIDEEGLHSYGLHRRLLEKFIENHFSNRLIVRLPGLIGPRLRKNVIFDFLHNHNLHAIDSRGVFQFYPMVNLWYDIQAALNTGLKLVHLTAEPICVGDVSRQGFGKPFNQVLEGTPAKYDMQTRYASLFGAEGHYQYSSHETIQAIRSYAQSEPLTIKSDSEANA